MSIACGITKQFIRCIVNIYDLRTKKGSRYAQSEYKPIQGIIDELITKYGGDVGKIAVDGSCLRPDQLEDFKKEALEKYGDLVHVATEEELDFEYYLEFKVEYSVGEFIILIIYKTITLYQCTGVVEGRVTWKEMDKREHGITKRVDLEYAVRMFRLKVDQVHLVFRDSQEKVDSLYGSELYKHAFKSINFIKDRYISLEDRSLLFARCLISDPDVPVLVKTISSDRSISSQHLTIEDWGFIHLPKLVKEYEPRTDIMGIDLGSTRSVLAVSRNREIQVVPFDNSSPGDLWTESVVSFDGEKPIIGKAAVRRLRTNPDCVIFDMKLLWSQFCYWNKSEQSIWPFKLRFKDGQPCLESMTSEGLKTFSLAEINKIFLEQMKEAASEYQNEFNDGGSVKKAVITVSQYYSLLRYPHPLISSIMEAAKLANIEVIDIIEETHADLLYYLSNEKYSEMMKNKKKIAIFDIRGGSCSGRVYKISEYKDKRYANCVREVYELPDEDCRYLGRGINDIIMRKLEESIPENSRSNLKLRTLEAAKKIKHELSSKEDTECHLSEIDLSLEETVELTREWFEGELEGYFKHYKLYYDTFIQCPLPYQMQHRSRHQPKDMKSFSPFNDVSLVLSAGGTCRIPFVKRWIGRQFPNANIIMDEQLEIITATGAAIHALQVLSGEVQPYIKPIQHPIACGITKNYSRFHINIYDVRTKGESDYSRSKNRSIQEIIDELITKYGGDVGKIVVGESGLEPDQLEEFKKEALEKYGDLVHVATREELDFYHYLELKVGYSVGEFIVLINDKTVTLYQCTEVVEGRVTWKEMDNRKYLSTKRVDLEYAVRMFRLKVDQVHLVFRDSQEKVDSLYGSELYKHAFKSINFIKDRYISLEDRSLLFARCLISDPDVPVLVKTISSDRSISSQHLTIEDWGFIHLPKLVKEYEPRTDIMGIDLGSTRSVLAVSRNREIQVVPFDNSSPGDLWTESVVSFDGEKPIIGKAAVRRLRTNPDCVIFDMKLLWNQFCYWNKSEQSIWPFNLMFKDGQPCLESMTSEGLKTFSLAEINKLFVEQMKEAASEYQHEFNDGESVKRAVITVPEYYSFLGYPHFLISSIIETAKLANIEIIDIIEETHADLLYYLSNEKYSEMMKNKKKIAIFDIGGGTCSCRVYEISEYKGKRYTTCVGEVFEFADEECKYLGRGIDNIIMRKLEESIPEDSRSNLKLRTLEAAKKIKHELSSKEKTECHLSEIDSSLEGTIELTREWFEGELEGYFKNYKLYYNTFKQYLFPIQRKFRCKREQSEMRWFTQLNNIDIVFLAGGTCRIPFVHRWIGTQFPNANIIMDGELEIITATGAAIHALQVLSGEVQSYIKPIQHPVACGINKDSYVFVVNIYDVRTKKSDYFRSKDKSIQEIVNELITKYGGDVGKIVVDESRLKPDQLEDFKKRNLKKYGDLVHVATEEELDFEYYLEFKVEYSVGEFIVLINWRDITLYQCTEAAKGRVTWKEMDKREHGFTKRVDLEYAARMFRLKVDQVHLVFEESQEKVDSLYGSGLYNYGFKSINFIHRSYRPTLLLARHLISDPDISMLVKTISSYRSSSLRNFTIQEWGFIHVPKLVKEYESRTDIMGIDLGSTRSVLVVSRNREIQVVPFDNSSPGDLWTESVVSFDEEKPIIGKAAVGRLRNKPDCVIFDMKLLWSQFHYWNKSEQSIWPFKLRFKDGQPCLESMTSEGLKTFSLAEINKLFLEQMKETASEYQYEFNGGGSVKKAVITVPQYYSLLRYPHPLISSIIEAAKLANIEVIDIIEETHADLLYYLSNEEYSGMMKDKKKIAIFDIRGGISNCKVYEISEYKGKRYTTCVGEVFELDDEDCKYLGRGIDDIIMRKLEESIPEDSRSNLKLRTLEAAKNIKHELFSKEDTECHLSVIGSSLEGAVELTREWFEGELGDYFKNYKLYYDTFIQCPLPYQMQHRSRYQPKDMKSFSPLNDIEIVFLAGGTCRILFVQRWIGTQFPNANIIMDGQLETITATGAAIHALQVLSGEVQSYIKPLQHPIVCGITKKDSAFIVITYDLRTKKKDDYSRPKDNPIQEIIDELITKYGGDVGKIVVDESRLKPDQLEDFKKRNLKKYGDLVHVATKEELDFNHYLKLKVEYSVKEFIVLIKDKTVTLYQCAEVVEGRVTWKEMDRREHGSTERVDLEYAARMFRLKVDQVHLVFGHTQEEVDSLYGSELYKHAFKSINFIKQSYAKPLLLARHLISHPDIPVLVKIISSYRSSSSDNFTIQDWGFIHVPKLVKEYESRTDIMGIDLGSTRSVLAVSRNREIQVVPFDNSSSGDLWTESVVSFDGKDPYIGKAAVRRLRDKPENVIFDAKLICNTEHRKKMLDQSIWSFKFNLKEEHPNLETKTSKEFKDFSLPDINKIFLERMTEAASEYQNDFNNGESVKKTVITVPRYYNWDEKKKEKYVNALVPHALEAAKLAKIEVIDIIEETHADLLYYFSKEEYAEEIKPGVRVAILDIGGGTCVCRVYTISEYKGKIYATCTSDSSKYDDIDSKYSGRSIDDITINKLEESIPEDLRKNVKLRTLEEAKKIKCRLSVEEKIEVDLSEIHPLIKGVIEFTKEWFEGELHTCFKDKLEFDTFKYYPLTIQKRLRYERKHKSTEKDLLFNDVKLVFLTGGTCRIPFIQEWAKLMFPKAESIIKEQLEIITATGAAIHAVQVLSGEVQPYIKPIQYPIACGIIKDHYGFEVNIYDVRTKKKDEYSRPKDKPIQKIIDELITKYGGDVGKIVVDESCLKSDQLEEFKKETLKKNGDLIHVATEEELNVDHYLEFKVEYSVGEFIVFMWKYTSITLYQCTEAVEGRVTWKEMDKRGYGFTKRVDLEYAARMFRLKVDQVHLVFENSQEEVDWLYGSELYKHAFKSINFTKWNYREPLLLARHLISDPDISIFVKTISSDRSSSLQSFIIQDWGFIHVPKLVHEYESRTYIMGIDLGSTRSVLTVSRNREIQVVPFDNSSPGDLWTESVISFDEEKPIIGKAAVERRRTKSDCVIFDMKLLWSQFCYWNKSEQSIWPFKLRFKDGQPCLESMTSEGLKTFSLAEINKLFLEQMKETASEYQNEFNDGGSVKKAVITVSQYYSLLRYPHPLISSIIEAAKLANIEVIDIIEETHADLLYYLSNEEYSEMIKDKKKIAIFDIGGGTFNCKVYEISEYKGKRYTTCVGEVFELDDEDCKYLGRGIDDIIMRKLEESIPEDSRSNLKLRTLEAAKKIKHELSSKERTECHLSEIDSSLGGTVELTRKWFEGELEDYFKNYKLYYDTFIQCPLPYQIQYRSRHQPKDMKSFSPLNDVDIVFLAGGTCRILFVQRWIGTQFPNANIIMDGQLETITATGAAIHALQVLSGEVQPYIKPIQHPIACGITKNDDGFIVITYDLRTKKDDYSESLFKPIQEIIHVLFTKYGGDVGKIVVDESDLDSDQLEEFRKEALEKYGDLVHVATKVELDFNGYLEFKVEYSVGEMIILFHNRNIGFERKKVITLYQCTEAVEGRVTWKEMDEREHGSTERVDLEYAARMVRLKVDQIHLVFGESQEKVDSLYGSELYNYGFKSINFIKKVNEYSRSHYEALFLARHLISDPDVPVLVKNISSYQSNNPQNFTIQDWGFIHVPKLVKEYESRTDIMGIDLGSTRSVLAVSRNREIRVVPFDNSSPGDLWTESVISFDEEKPIIGKSAVGRLRTKPDCVIFDAKLICNTEHRKKMSEQSIWSFKFNLKEEHPNLETKTSKEWKEFFLPDINKIFLERMAEAASEYQNELNNGESVKKAVITVPRYSWDKKKQEEYVHPLISYVIEAAKLANIEIIDIIEETHADFLYYFSKEEYSDMIKPGMRVAILDIGGGTCVCRIYTISEYKGKIYATCMSESSEYDDIDSKYSGRSIDDIIINKLEESIPEDLMKNMRLRTLEEAKKIKCRLSVEEKIEFDLSEIHPRLEGIVEFTKEWFEGELRTRFKDELEFDTFKYYPLTIQRKFRCKREHKSTEKDLLFNDVKLVFLAGGTCKIPFVQRWIGAQFPNANIVIDGELEIITATGAAIHAVQVLSGEVQPYIKPIQHPIACGITKNYGFEVNIYDIRTKRESRYSYYKNESIQEIIDELITKYGGDVGKIVVDEICLKPDQLEDFKKGNLEKYNDVVRVAIKDELNFKYYLELKVEYSVGEFIVSIQFRTITLYQCTEFVEGRVKWKGMDKRECEFTERVDLEYAARMFRLKVDQVHLVFEDSQEKVDSLYGSELHKYGFKSINFIGWSHREPLFLARYLNSDPDVSMLVKMISSDRREINTPRQSDVVKDEEMEVDTHRINPQSEAELRTKIVKKDNDIPGDCSVSNKEAVVKSNQTVNNSGRQRQHNKTDPDPSQEELSSEEKLLLP